MSHTTSTSAAWILFGLLATMGLGACQGDGIYDFVRLPNGQDNPDFGIIANNNKNNQNPPPIVDPDTGMIIDPDTGQVIDPPDMGTEPDPVSRPGPWMIRRLTRDHYATTIHDLLGVTLPESELAKVPLETRTEGFENNVLGLVVTTEHVEAYLSVAEYVAGNLNDWDGFLSQHTSCRNLSEAACEEEYISSVAGLLWRRPAKTEEVARLRKVFERSANEGVNYQEAAGYVLQAILSTPQFLYIIEDESGGRTRTIGGYEMASRLAYLLWQSAPDDALLSAAADGTLDTSAGILEQANRMLQEQAIAQRGTERFVRDWFALDRLQNAIRQDLSLSEARELLQGAVHTYQQHVWSDQSKIMDVFTTEQLSMGRSTARKYGFEDPKNGMQRYDISGMDERFGIMTHPAVLTSMSDRDVGGIVARGLFVMEDLQCQHPSDPPAGLNLDDFKDHLPAGSTERDYAEDRLKNNVCGACHIQFDPFAFAFERYDGAGLYVLQNDAGNDLRQDGELRTPAGETVMFANTEEYVTYMGQEPAIESCIVKKHIEFALGQHLDRDEYEGTVEKVRREWVRTGGTYEALVRAIVVDEVFRTARVEAD